MKINLLTFFSTRPENDETANHFGVPAPSPALSTPVTTPQSQFICRLFWVMAVLLATSFPAVFAATANPQTHDQQWVNQVLTTVDDLWRGKSSHVIMTMQIKTRHYHRSMQMEGWSLGKEKSLVRILRPLREKGLATLKSGNHIFSYLPKTDRTIRLTSGMMMGAWMGSHLTNDDLVKESRMAEDYTATLSFEGRRGQQDVLEFTLIPRPDAAVVWGKVVLEVLADQFTPLRETFYDESMMVARRFAFSGVKTISGRQIPTVMRVEPADQPGEFTELLYQKMVFDLPLGEQFFSLSRLKAR